MNASQIIAPDMTLEEKLAAIDAAVKQAAQATNAVDNQSQKISDNGQTLAVPVDPALSLMCQGCQ